MSKPGTALPWRADFNDVPYEEMNFEAWTVDSESGSVCTVDSGRMTAEQDAHYIVRAANCFPELVEALEALTLFHESGGHEGDADEAIALARAALAKANEGEGR